MKSIVNDIIALTLGLSIIATFSTLLYQDFTSRLKAENAKQIGTITFKKKSAYRKYSKQVIWESIEQNAPIYNNDSIRTQENSEAVVKLDDGTDIGMEESSMILFSLDKNTINIDFQQGSISANRASGTDSQIQITSQDALVSLSSGDIQLSKSENADLNLKVSSGEASFSSANQNMTLGQDQALFLYATSHQTKVVKYDISLNSPSESAISATTAPTMDVPFSFKGEGISDTSIELSTKRNFNSLISSVKSAGTSTIPLKPGTYFWRVKGKSAEKVDTISETRKITIIRDFPINTLFPSDKTTIPFEEGSPIVNFQWSKNNLALSFVLEISTDEQFASIIRKTQTPQNSLAIDDLPQGKFFWRVTANSSLPGSSYANESSISSFSIEKNVSAKKLSPTYPTDNSRFSTTFASKDGITFSWAPEPTVQHSRLILATDEAFSAIVFDLTTDKNFISVKQSIQPGRYYWKIREDRPGEATPFSEARSFTVFESNPVSLNFPADKSEIELGIADKTAQLSFGWSQLPGNSYQLEISRDNQFLDVTTRTISDKNAVSGIKLVPGKYYWRVNTIDKERNVVAPSLAFSVTISKPVQLPAVLAGKTEAVNLQPEIPAVKVEKPTVIEITTDVRSAEIYINGNLAGKRKVVVNPTPGDVNEIIIKAKGYQTYKQKITVEKSETKTLTIALKKETESRIHWSVSTAGPQLSQPVITDKYIITSASNRNIYAMTFSGATSWKTKLDSIIKSTPSVSKERIYIVDVAENLYSLDLNSGKILWKKKVNGPLLFGAKPLIIKDMIYFATSYGYLYSFKPDGTLDYEEQIDGGVYSSLTYYPEKDWLIAGTDQSTILAFTRKSGGNKWTLDTDDRVAGASPAVLNKNLYVPTRSGALFCIDIKSQKVKWKFNAASSFSTTPLISGKSIYIGDEDGALYALNLDGKLIWKRDIARNETYDPYLYNSLLYVTAGNSLVAIDPADSGKITWKFDFESRITTPPSAIGNHIYTGLKNGSVFSIKENIYKD